MGILELDAYSWRQRLRIRDFHQLFGSRNLPAPLLEIGSGDGTLSRHLRKRSKEVVAIDPAPRAPTSDFVRADAQDLPFRSDYFQFVFSSNVLEHVEDVDACLSELHRVTTDDAVMVHTMPTIYWKALQFGLRPVYAAQIVSQRLMGRGNGCMGNRTPDGGHDDSRSLIQRILPPIHGTSGTHFQEFAAFRRSAWLKRFGRNGFEVVSTHNMYVHSPYALFPDSLQGVRSNLSRMGMPSVIAYKLKKRHRRRENQQWHGFPRA